MMISDYQDIHISEDLAAALAKQHFQLNVQAKSLAGTEDFNFFLKTNNGEKYLLKVSRPGANVDEIDFTIAAMEHLHQKAVPVDVPYAHADSSGKKKIAIQDDKGRERWLRLHAWVPGCVMANVNPQRKDLLENLGKTLGYVSKGLADFDHPFSHRKITWDSANVLELRENRTYIKDIERLAIVDHFWAQYESLLPKIASLRKQVCHNDGNNYNILVNDDLYSPKIQGIIDFGDAVYTQTIHELAIACMYAMSDRPDPIGIAQYVVKGYHAIFPLQETEVELLFTMIATRALVSVAHSSKAKFEEPENEYLQISERSAWNLLNTLYHYSPDLAHYHFRAACGWEPCPKHELFVVWANKHPDKLSFPVACENLTLHPMDLSVESLELGNHATYAHIDSFDRKVRRILEDHEADIGVGGYGESRSIYTTNAYEQVGNWGPQWRTIHLGYDIWANSGTEVCAIAKGTVYGFANNIGDRNYGPTIILAHKVSDDLTFYSLYGHLSKDSLDGLKEGQHILKGETIGRIGPAPENGNWPPHLHVQLILDMLGEKGDFPGVAFPSEKEIWLSVCPASAHIFPGFSPKTDMQEKVEQIITQRKASLGRGMSISYAKPLHIVRGYQQYLFDMEGQRYLDTANNVAHVGHEHPKVVKAAQEQAAVLNTNTRYLHENITGFAEELLATFPPELCVCHFVNSGSEANELAIRMARTYTGQKDMLAVEVGYHGNTGACIDVSSYKFDGKGGQGAPEHTHIVPIPDVYRGVYRDPKEAGKQYANHIQDVIKEVKAQGRNIAGFICESILSCGGQIVLPENYLKTAFQYVRDVGGLCIMDEVQVGFGRVGKHFWGFELQGVLPDIVTMGKPIGNGHPLAAVVTTRAVANAFANGMEYFNTFGGNPVSCAIGRAVLSVIREDDLQTHALEVGNYLKDQLRELANEFPLIGDVRGHGLFLGFELVRDHESREAADTECSYLANRMREQGILISTDGPFHNVIKIKPPMCFSKENADVLVSALRKTFREDFLRKY